MREKPRFFKAVKNTDIALMEKLLLKKPDLIREGDIINYRPAFYAMLYGEKDNAAIHLLLDRGIKPNDITGNGWTVLQTAVIYNHIGVVQRILGDCPALVEQKTRDGSDLLSLAAMNGHVAIASYIVSLGVRPNVRNDAALNAYDHALKSGGTDMIALLKDLRDPPPVRPARDDTAADVWINLSDTRVSHIMNDAAAGYRLTDIYNFAAQERTRLCHNVDTALDVMETRAFSSLDHDADLAQAAARLGLKADAYQKTPLVFSKSAQLK